MCNGQTCCSTGGCTMNRISRWLLIIGGLNWLLVGVGMLMGGDYNVVKIIFGSIPTLEAIVYVLVGLAAVMKLFHCKCSKCANPPSTEAKM